MPPKPETYISVDIEASGPTPGDYSLLSIGACVVGNLDQTFYSELKPINDQYVPKAMEVNGLSLTHLSLTGEAPGAAMARFDQWVHEVSDNTRPVFVAFNATFDWSFTHWYFMKFFGHDPFGISGLDIKAYFMGKHGVPWNQTTKKQVKSRYPSQLPHTHNALDDSKEQAELFAHMLKSSPHDFPGFDHR